MQTQSGRGEYGHEHEEKGTATVKLVLALKEYGLSVQDRIRISFLGVLSVVCTGSRLGDRIFLHSGLVFSVRVRRKSWVDCPLAPVFWSQFDVEAKAIWRSWSAFPVRVKET